MNELLKQKRDNFRIQLRNKELNEKLCLVRTANLSNNGTHCSKQVLEFAKKFEFHFQDIRSLNQYLKTILDSWESHNDEILCKSLELMGAQYVMDLEIEWFDITSLQTALTIFRSKEQNFNIVDSIVKLLINTSYHYDWVTSYLLEQNIFESVFYQINSTQNKLNLQHVSIYKKKKILTLLGNLVINNLEVQAKILSPQIFNKISSKIDDYRSMEQFLIIIRNLQHTYMQKEEIRLIINFWINNKPECESLRDIFYQIMSALTYSSRQAYETFALMDQNRIISDAINDLKSFQQVDNLEYCLSFLVNLSTLDHEFIMVLVNNGILEAVTIQLSKDLFLYDNLYMIISNVTIHEEYFQQACLFGCLRHLQRHIIYNSENPNLTILREILHCLGQNIENHCSKFIFDFLDNQIDVALIYFIKSELACYAREELLFAIKILYKLWNIQINRNANDKQLWSKLIQIQLEEFQHQETDELINLIENYEL